MSSSVSFVRYTASIFTSKVDQMFCCLCQYNTETTLKPCACQFECIHIQKIHWVIFLKSRETKINLKRSWPWEKCLWGGSRHSWRDEFREIIRLAVTRKHVEQKWLKALAGTFSLMEMNLRWCREELGIIWIEILKKSLKAWSFSQMMVLLSSGALHTLTVFNVAAPRWSPTLILQTPSVYTIFLVHLMSIKAEISKKNPTLAVS